MDNTKAQNPAVAADALRRIAEEVATWAPVGFGRDVKNVRRLCEVMASAYIEHDSRETCRRCGDLFTFRLSSYTMHGMTPPVHCHYCRQQRRITRIRKAIPAGGNGTE